MQSYIKRKEFLSLQNWLEQGIVEGKHKPLIVRGARQVGKSTLIRFFVNQSDYDLLEINFERNPEYQDAFTTNDPDQIIMMLSLLTGKTINDNTILFFDEIQMAPKVLLALRYFYEEKPELPILCAGSLLEFTLAETQYSMPVGRIEYLHLGPLQFEDFLLALGETQLHEFLQKLTLVDIQQGKLINAVHQKLMGLLQQYWIVGGLPEAVVQFARNKQFTDVARIQQSVVATYRDDFNKYSHGSLKARVQLVYDKLPLMVGKKFKYSQVSRDHRAAQIEDALQQLCLAKIATRVYHSSANGLPLGAQINEKVFKIVYLDIGLISAALNLNVLDLTKQDLSLINSGALAEQFIGQHLLYAFEYYQTPSLYYWVREKKSAAAEIDYLMTGAGQVVPIEIKAGSTGSLKSLHQFLQEKQRPLGVRFNADLPSLLDDQKKLSNGKEIDYQLLSLPLYLVGQVTRLVKDCFDSN